LKVLQINTKVNSGSTGRIAEEIGKTLMLRGHESYIGYGRGNNKSVSKTIPIGEKFDVTLHGVETLLFDRHGLGSRSSTNKFLKVVDEIKPDLIQLHNLHGYYFNYKIFFDYVKKRKIQVVWTLHDCWSFTGHCTYFDNINCTKWIMGCNACPKKKMYPKSLLFDRSKLNFEEKKEAYGNYQNLQIVTPSFWLYNYINNSFLKQLRCQVIHNGIDLDVFKPFEVDRSVVAQLGLQGKKVVLGVASVWDKRKGLSDFIELSKILNFDYQIVLIGIDKKSKKTIPDNIICIDRTESTSQLAAYYSLATVFINPTWQDNFPTTNIEALACGTPVITYNTGGSPEAIDDNTGVIIDRGDISGLKDAIEMIAGKGKESYQEHCRNRAVKKFDKNIVMNSYVDFYEGLISNQGGN
jgi:putative colanic acid biosynthesis glycosyltransferase